jgi:hypothetical protein
VKDLKEEKTNYMEEKMAMNCMNNNLRNIIQKNLEVDVDGMDKGEEN